MQYALEKFIAGRAAIDLVIKLYTNKQMLIGAYLDPRRSSTTSKSALIGNYEAFVVMLYCQLQQLLKLCLVEGETKLNLNI